MELAFLSSASRKAFGVLSKEMRRNGAEGNEDSLGQKKKQPFPAFRSTSHFYRRALIRLGNAAFFCAACRLFREAGVATEAECTGSGFTESPYQMTARTVTL